MSGHTPVLFSDVLQFLQLKANDDVIDATLGGGGHAAALLEAIGPDGRLLGLEADQRTLDTTAAELTNRFGARFIPMHSNFRRVGTEAAAHGFSQVAGVLFDLGLSSMTIEDAARGFSFQNEGPLDMRFDPSAQELTAAEIVNEWPERRLVEIFQSLGEEPRAQAIAAHLVSLRRNQPFSSTVQLADAISQVKRRFGKTHPATQVFQALRMAVNDELGALLEALPQAVDLLKPNGRLAVITFHSIEDRVVKYWMKEQAAAEKISLINKHVIVPGRDEQVNNPRSRSAKLRVVQKNS